MSIQWAYPDLPIYLLTFFHSDNRKKMRIFSTLIFTLIFVGTSYSQSSSSFWNDIEENEAQISNTAERITIPNNFRMMSLDFEGIKTFLNNAPKYSGVSDQKTLSAVSYTHLTLPTICSV